MKKRLFGKKRLGDFLAVIAILGVLVVLSILGVSCGRDDEPITRGSSDYGWLKVEEVVIVATGAAGAATGSGSTDRDIQGHIYAIHLDYGAGITTTTDITVVQALPPLIVIQKDDSATDAWYYPAVQQTDSAGSGLGTYDRIAIDDALDITVGQTTSSTTMMTATVYWGK